MSNVDLAAWPKDSTPPVAAPCMLSGARRAVSASSTPCQDIAVALSAIPAAAIASSGQRWPKTPSASVLAAMPSASPAIISRGATKPLPSQPQRMRHGTATSMASEKIAPAAARSWPCVVRKMMK